MTFDELTIAHIKDRTEEVGDCWIWQQGSTNGYPQMKIQGRCCKLVRRMVVDLDGRPAEPRQPVITTCGEMLCVNPAHLKATSTSDAAMRAAEKGGLEGQGSRCQDRQHPPSQCQQEAGHGQGARNPHEQRVRPGAGRPLRRKSESYQRHQARHRMEGLRKPVCRTDGGAMNVPQLQRRPARPGQLSVFRGRLPVLRSPSNPVHPAPLESGPGSHPHPLPHGTCAGDGAGLARAGNQSHGEAGRVAITTTGTGRAARILARTAQAWEVKS